MGWLFMHSLGGFAGPRQYLDDQFTYERPRERARVLRSALVATRAGGSRRCECPSAGGDPEQARRLTSLTSLLGLASVAMARGVVRDAVSGPRDSHLEL